MDLAFNAQPKFVKYFKGLEIEPIVLTRECDQEQDVTLFEDVPNDTKIIRTKAYDYTQWPQPFALFGKVIARKIFNSRRRLCVVQKKSSTCNGIN